MLLDELRQRRPGGVWQLWGDEARLAQYVFPAASVKPWAGDPNKNFGQADFLRVPANDVAIYLHQIRPLRPGLSITFFHDTIPLRFESRRSVRWAKALFFRIASRLSTRLLTVSEPSRVAVVRDLRVAASKVFVTRMAVDPARVARIRALRANSVPGCHILFIGRFAKHKNLRRLCRAFQTTAFRREGGRLVLVGGSQRQVADLSAFAVSEQLSGMDIRGVCTEADLEVLLATCRALVQPSLEEGFGLPAVEAASAGVQVAASRTGFAQEIPDELATRMDPLDEASIAAAIDHATSRPDSDVIWLPRSSLAADVIATIANVLSSRRA
jgi:glycosyltransferase involved in cell wall biosynthesis